MVFTLTVHFFLLNLFPHHSQGIKHSKLLTAAIDFGTTYSGYAVMTRSDYQTLGGDSSKIHCPTWIRDGGMSYKAPTSVLFRPNKKFHSFGYEAEKYYHENSDSQDFKEWYFFKHFKMKLYTEKVWYTFLYTFYQGPSPQRIIPFQNDKLKMKLSKNLSINYV